MRTADWIGPLERRPREDALAELARRYLRGHGPASERDLAWWSGLPVTVARRAIAALGPIVERVAADGGDLWAIAAEPPARGGGTHLLPAFDEYTVAYRDRRAVLAPEHASRVNAGGGILHPVIVSAGRVVGTWRRQARRGGVTVRLAPFAPLPPARRAAVAAAAKRYGAFVGLPVVVE